MARTITWSSMRDQARQLADEVNSQFITDAMLLAWVNDSVAEVYALVAEADPDTYTDTDSVATTAGTTEYALDAELWKVRGVDVTVGARTYAIKSFEWIARASLYASTDPWIFDAPYGVRYCIRGNNIVFLPDPGTRTYTVHYIPAPPTITADGDTFDGFAGFEAWIKWDLVIKMCMRAETDPSIALMERDRLTRRIQKLAKDRDKAEAPQTADTFFGARGYR